MLILFGDEFYIKQIHMVVGIFQSYILVDFLVLYITEWNLLSLQLKLCPYDLFTAVSF